MTETGLLVAQVAFLVLLFGFLAAVVRSSARQLGRVQPPALPPSGPVVDPPRRPASAAPLGTPPPATAPPAPAPPPAAAPDADAAEGSQSTLEPFPSPLGDADAPTVLPGAAPDPDAPLVAAQVPAVPDPVPDAPGADTALEADEPAPQETEAGQPVAADMLDSSTRARSAQMMDLTSGITPRLIVESSPSLEVGSDLELEGGLTIGRSGAADLSISDQYVSHMHARIMRRGPYYFVEDLGSTNGTFLNDRRVDSSAQLKVHDSLRMGQTTLRYQE